ncbi:MAG: autotransporter-associated beta strand repeat-containing protein, partial [Verrucomicrobiota bacterium]
MPELRMRGGERGEEAIQMLGARLPEVAAHHRRSAAELRAMLRRDRSLRLDSRGRLHYLCEGLIAPVVGGQTNLNDGPVAALFPLPQTFLLHSKPGANKKIFLDFDGHTLSENAWTANYNGGTNIVAPPWDTDGNPGSFSSDEQTAIQQIWFRVAEDFAGFDVDVTTEFPGEAALTRNGFVDSTYGTRALVSAISSYIGNYGGIAYVGVFDAIGDYNKPALVFPEKLSNNEKNIAEAISHEVGHNLGLSHDGIAGGAEYYTGQGNWAPIMGVGYSKPIVQWSRGEYATPSNPENDYTIIGMNGLSFRADDYGNTTGTASALAGFISTNFGIIERTNDVDFFSFQTGGGAAELTITPWERGANVHFLLALYDSTGTLLTNREVADTGSGVQRVTINAILGAGLHYVSVEGIGSGNPLTSGYSDYGSLGNYTLTVNLPPASQWLPTAGGNFSWTNPANWFSGAVPNSPDAAADLINNIAGDQTITLDAPITISRLILGDTNATHGFTLTSGGGGGFTLDGSSDVVTISKMSGTNDLIAASLVLQDDLSVSNSTAARLTLAGTISGGQALTKTGAGLVALAGTNSYTGDTIISAGTLALDGTAAFSGAARFTVDSNAILNTTAFSGGWQMNTAQQFTGNGSVVGDVVFNPGSKLHPGPTNAAGTLTFSNQLAFTGGATWHIDLAATNSVGGGTNDLVVVGGNLALAGTNTIQVNLLDGELVSPGTYTILSYGGAMSGGASNLIATSISRLMFVVDDSVPGEIRLQVSLSPADLIWRGDGVLNRWDTDTFNWRNGGSSDKFYALDSVTFDDSGSNNTSIQLQPPLAPAVVTVAAAKNYAFSGAGWLTGMASVNKIGTGTLTMATANDFTGTVTVGAGVLKVAGLDALGSASGATLVTNSGVLDVNGTSLGGELVIVSGAGAGAGAIINSGAPQPFAVRAVTLMGDSTFGGSERWDVRAFSPGTFAGNNYKLTKTGTNEIWLADLGDTGLGDIEVQAGELGIQGSTTLGNPAGALVL